MTALRMHIRIAAAALLASLPLAAASAQEVEEAAERLKAYADDQGFRIEWDRVEVNGSDGVLVGVRAGNEEAMAPIGDIELTGVSRDDKGIRIDSMTLPYFTATNDEDGVAFYIRNVEMGNVVLADEAMYDVYGGFLFCETATIDSISLNLGGTEVFTLSDMHFESTEPDRDTPMAFSGAAESFTLDMSLMEDQNQLAVLKALGYDQIEGYFEMEGSWNTSDGRFTLTQYDMTVVEAGTIGFTFDLGGATPALMASLRELQKQMEQSPEGDNSAQGLAILGLLQQLTFHEAEIAFSDDLLTGKVLEFVAGNQGMKPADVANQAKAVVPFALAQLNNPELTTQATQAVSAFLDDPQNLTISAKPAQPVPFALIMATAMTTPIELTKSLGVGVRAND